MSNKTILHISKLIAQRNNDFCLSLSQLELHSGTILCITGPNGSGKTTLIESIAGLYLPDSGKVTVCGKPINNSLYSVRRHIGYIPDDENWLIPELTAEEYIKVLSKIYTQANVNNDFKTRYDELSKQLYFTAHNIPIVQLSHGNKKKVQIIAGLLHKPDVIVVDELRNGLDPLAIAASEKLLRTEALRGACIIAATHDLWWAERTAHEILVLLNGEAVLHKTTEAIKQEYESLVQAFQHITEQEI